MKKIYYLFFLVLGISKMNAQQIHRCYTTEYIEHLSQSNLNIKQDIKNTFDAAKAHTTTQASFKSTAPTTIYRIPVVFHIVYNTAAENVADSLVYSQLKVLNNDFRKLNADTVNHRAIFKDRAADVGFEFYLATLDPDGNITNGITRTETDVTDFSGGGFFPDPNAIDDVKSNTSGGKDAWDADNYLNIWICNTGGSILGFAYPPETAPNWPAGQVPANKGKWGVVISHIVFGYNNPLATGGYDIADQGRTAVHEVGHYFGLRHIWGDAGSAFFPGADCDITKDDGIDDTPHMGENSQTSGCDFNKNSCTNGETPDEPDMPENYMDYSTETCQNMFTEGQADIMRSMAVTGRPDLAEIITNETIIVESGDYIVVNNTDTIIVDANTYVEINEGDKVVFLNENNGYSYTVNHDGQLQGTDNYAVTADGEITVSGVSGINQIETNNLLVSVFPNPAKSSLTLINHSKNKLSAISITNVEGKTFLIESNLQLKENKIDLSSFDTGLYFISLYDGQKLFSVKKISIVK